MKTPMKKDVALVLSSGGARGYAHIGAIKAINEWGGRITSVAGTSMGAVVGGLYAAGKLDEAYRWMKTIDNWEMFRLADFKNLSKRGLLDGEYLFQELEKIVGNVMIEDLPIDFCAVAADLDSGEEVVFRTGKLLDAIRASISLPVFFTPYEFKGRRYVDGGVVNGMPINRVKRHDGDIVVAINIDTYGEEPPKKPIVTTPQKKKNNKGWFSFFRKKNKSKKKIQKKEYYSSNNVVTILLDSYSISLKQNKLMMRDMTNPDIYVTLKPTGHGMVDFSEAETIAGIGYNQMMEELNKYNA